MVEYLSGNRIQGSSTLTVQPAQTSWKEIGRFTVTTATDEIVVRGLNSATSGSMTEKDQIKVLIHAIGSSSGNLDACVIRFNGENTSSGASRYTVTKSNNDSADDSNVNENGLNIMSSNITGLDFFCEMDITNNTGHEKICFANTVGYNNDGAGTTPNRKEMIGKWIETSDRINKVTLANRDGSGNFAAGSEVVVLGMNVDEADSGTNFWQELTTTDNEMTGNSSGNTVFETETFAKKKWLMVEYYLKSSGDPRTNFNDIDAGHYAWTYTDDGGTQNDGGTSNSSAGWHYGGNEVMGTAFVVNKEDAEKLYLVHTNYNSGTGDGTTLTRREIGGKFAKTDQQIEKIRFYSSSVTGYAGTYMRVFGSD